MLQSAKKKRTFSAFDIQTSIVSQLNFCFLLHEKILEHSLWFQDNRNQDEGDLESWCNPLNLQPEQSGGVGPIPGRTPTFERRDKGSQA